MDQSEVNQIIMDSMEPDIGNKFEKLDKEFMILKGSIKKLILDIREQMNNTDNPFSNIQMLQMPPPAPVIKEDPVEFEVPKDKEKPAAEEKKVQADKPVEQADKDKNLAQDKNTGNSTVCPYASKAGEVQGRCPLSANGNTQDLVCPLAIKSRAQDYSRPSTTHYNDLSTTDLLKQLAELLYQSINREHEARNTRNDPYRGGFARTADRHVWTTCGRPPSPGYDGYPGNWPYPYPPYHQNGWPERQGRDISREPGREQAYDSHPYFYNHPEYEPAQYWHPYSSGYPGAREEDSRYRRQSAGRLRVARASPGSYPEERDDRYYYEQDWCEPRQPTRDYYEPDYYRPAARPRRVCREPADLPDARYYGPAQDVQHEPARYRTVPRRRHEPYPPEPQLDAADEFEMTEPLPEIDLLPDEPEPEEEPLRIRKKARIARIMPEPVHPGLVEQPNPKPRRSRAVKHRS